MALFRERAARISLPSSIGWDLHAHSHAAPFAEWAGRIADLVMRGIVPDMQRGSYDLRLDVPEKREAWQRALFDLETPRSPASRGGALNTETGARAT